MQPQYIASLGLLCLVLFCEASSNAQPAEQAPRFVDISPNSLIFLKDTYYYIESSAPKNWFNALLACKKIGYQLVSLQNSEKFNLLVSFLVSSRKSLYFWTSGNDLYTSGAHHWYPSNDPVLDGLWGPRQPDNVGGVEHCDALWKTSKNYTLKDNNCNLAKNYICELGPPPPPPPPPPSAPTDPDDTTTTTDFTTTTDSSDTTTESGP